MPTVPRGPRAPGRLRLAPVRTSKSTRLDGQTIAGRMGREDSRTPPFIPWDDFYSDFASRYVQGHHVTCVGTTGSGKTVLAREIILLRRYVAVAATKIRDDSLYGPLEEHGFVTRPTFDADHEQYPRQIVNPPLLDASATSRREQAEVYREMIAEIWGVGNWTFFADEVRYLTANLKLAVDVETLWLQGRSMGVGVVAGTQRPVGIPLEAFSLAHHLFLFRENDQRNIDRMAEFVAGDKDVARHVIPRLPRFECLYIERETGRMARTKVKI